MKNDIDAQFLCKDCARYSQCRYYHNRKEDSHICKYFEFHLAVPDNCMGCEYKEQEPCEDCISRQTVIDSIRNYFHDEYYQRTSIQDCRDCLIEDVIKSLPPVTPIRPKGEWETGYTYPDGEYWKCSECGELIKVKFPMNFCNSCGADMRPKDNV